ncbi:MAG: SUMF1/EgtB/PvdO family nonheme iron enzyme [Spirochaetales bacterium]|jgi:formylglycine-generating enzyme required for sulfatase activity
MPSPLSIVAAARTALAAIGQGKAGAVWLRDVLDKKSAEKVAPIAAAALKDSIIASAPKPRGSISLAGSDFILFSSGDLTLGGEAPSGSQASYSAMIPAFGIARTEVTNRQWAEFLAAKPDWRGANKAALQEKGLVDDSYLADWNGANDNPVTGVSWHAATAYCEWLSSKSGGAYEVVLPSEAMWEAAARAGLSDPASTLEKKATWSDGTRTGPSRAGASGYSASGLADMFGNVWEWTAEAYRPYPAFASGLLSGDEKAVRGGSWANSPDSISLYSRGGMPSAHASAFLGFRPAIVQR